MSTDVELDGARGRSSSAAGPEAAACDRPARARLRRARRPLRPRRAARSSRGRRGRLRARPPSATAAPRASARSSRTARRSVADLHDVAEHRARASTPSLPVVADRPLDGRPHRHALRAALRRRASPRSCCRARRSAATRRCSGCWRSTRSPTCRSIPAVLSRDPAVGEAYAADELVYHGPFKRADAAERSPTPSTRSRPGPFGCRCRRCGSTATEDQLAPLEVTREAIERAPRPTRFEEKIYPGAPPRGLQRDQQGRGDRRRAGVPRSHGMMHTLSGHDVGRPHARR